MSNQIKKCSKCNIEKDLSYFNTRSNNRKKYHSWCKECLKNYKTAEVRWIQRHKDLDKFNAQKRESRKRNPITYMLKAAKMRAKRDELDYNLEPSDIIIPEFCPVLGLPLIIGSNDKDINPSLDRIDNNLGYIKGNVIVVSYRCNRIKNNSTEEERKKLYEFFEGRP